MEKNYYFVQEPGGAEVGPLEPADIARGIAAGTISVDAFVCRMGDASWHPLGERFATLANALRPATRQASGTTPPPPGPDPQPIPHHVHDAPPPPPAAALVPVRAPMHLPPEPHAHAPVPHAPRPPGRRRLVLGAAIGVGVISVAAIALAMRAGGGKAVPVKSAMVRVSTPSATGAGFFIAGPDGLAYVATANHVIDRGDAVLIERDVELGGNKHFVEAYPETEVVASDPDADLAIVRIKNVTGSRFDRLPLAKEPVKDEKILSYGYPGSSLADRAGLVSKDGKILSLVTFPAYDYRYDRVIRDNAVDGLLISTDIEPGFSGGPTINAAGEVVGVNVTKDPAHVGQNGAVSVVALRKLLATVKRADQHVDLKPENVVAMLERLERECLLLPVDDRTTVRETEFIAASDLPKLRSFVGEIRREERNSGISFSSYQLSGQAALGIYFARLPGKLLEAYRSPTTTSMLADCELKNQRLTTFLGSLNVGALERSLGTTVPASMGSCDDLALRPLAWDLAAATVQWDGTERTYAVTKLDKMDEDGLTYRAQVRISGAANLVEVWIGLDQGEPRLKLFDSKDAVYAVTSPRGAATTAMQGTWVMKRPRVTDAINKEAEVESEENLSLSITGDRQVSIRHVYTEHYYGAGARPLPFRCNHKTQIEVGQVQSFVGTLDNGVVVGMPEKPAEPVGADAGNCVTSRPADRLIAVKLVGDQLYLYRTDGLEYPETVQLTRQP